MRFDEQGVMGPVYPEYHAWSKVIGDDEFFAISIADKAPVCAAPGLVCCARALPSPVGGMHYATCSNTAWCMPHGRCLPSSRLTVGQIEQTDQGWVLLESREGDDAV